jgi:hypothetical protein
MAEKSKMTKKLNGGTKIKKWLTKKIKLLT